jgi:hypothetical protein
MHAPFGLVVLRGFRQLGASGEELSGSQVVLGLLRRAGNVSSNGARL